MEFTISITRAPPADLVFSLGRESVDPTIAISVRDEQASIRGHGEVGGQVERPTRLGDCQVVHVHHARVAADTGCPQGLLAVTVGRVAMNHVPVVIGQPDHVIPGDPDSVRPLELPLTPASQEAAVRRIDDHRVLAAIESVQVATGIGGGSNHLAIVPTPRATGPQPGNGS